MQLISLLEDLEMRFQFLNEGLVQELHEMIKPYILRRIKADVLKLPPKVCIQIPLKSDETANTIPGRDYRTHLTHPASEARI